MEARRIDLQLIYEKTDITNDVSKYIETIEYTDNASGESDDFQLGLEDRAGLWQNAWYPEKGAKITANLITRNWQGKTEIQFPCGQLEIDEITLSGPPDKIKLKALSVFVSGSIKEARSQGWESVTIEAIAKEIAARHGLSVSYSAAYNPVIDRKDQNEESDLSFLLQVCSDAGLCLKITNGTIIIFDEAEYEQREPAFTITKKDALSYGFTSKTAQIYKSAKVTYRQGKKKKTISGSATADDVDGTGKVLKINKKVSSIAEAEHLAKKKLRDKNRSQNTANITIQWRPDAAAGNMIAVTGFGEFDGAYFIDRARHSIRQSSSGSTIALELHKKLEGY